MFPIISKGWLSNNNVFAPVLTFSFHNLHR